MAMVNIQTLECIRPLHPHSTCTPKFFKTDYVEKTNVHILSIMEIDCSDMCYPKQTKPHIEDCYIRGGFTVLTDYHIHPFDILERTDCKSITTCFDMTSGDRTLSVDNPPKKSIITIKVPIENILFCLHSNMKGNSIRLQYKEKNGFYLKNIPIADNRIRNMPATQDKIDGLNTYTRKHPHIFIRFGLTRKYQEKYWLQINTLVASHDR